MIYALTHCQRQRAVFQTVLWRDPPVPSGGHGRGGGTHPHRLDEGGLGFARLIAPGHARFAIQNFGQTNAPSVINWLTAEIAPIPTHGVKKT